MEQESESAVRFAEDIPLDEEGNYPGTEGKEKTTTGYIEEHVDNDSVITFVLMLGRPGVDFIGGANNFARGEKHSVRRQTLLEQGISFTTL